MLLSPFPNAIGLDINDLSIKLVQLKNISRRSKGSSFVLSSARKTSLPHGLIADGIIQEPEKVRKYLQHILNKKGSNGTKIKSPWAVCSLPDSQGFLKLIHLEKTAEDVIEEDIKEAAKRHVPLDEGEYYLDWQIMPPHTSESEHTDILLTAIPVHLSDMYTYLLESVGLTPIALELRALSTARSVIPFQTQNSEGARAILDIGATQSVMTIYDHGYIQFSRALSYSGEILTTAISQKLHLDYEKAEELKKENGLEYQKSKVWPIVSGFTDKLVDDVQKTISFYYTHFPDSNKVTHIDMCGGVSAMSKLSDILSMKLNIECSISNIWQNLHSKRPITLSKEKSLPFATAAGLALRAADNPFFRSDTI